MRDRVVTMWLPCGYNTLEAKRSVGSFLSGGAREAIYRPRFTTPALGGCGSEAKVGGGVEQMG